MGLISHTAHVAGTVLTAAALNNNDNATTNQVNGNLETVNFANLSVTSAILASGAVTTAKLAAGVAQGLTTVTGVATDYLVLADTSDSGNIKKALASDFVVVAATQAEMEAASSTAVFASPGRVQYHPGVSKGWIVFDGTGTPAVSAAHNFDASITDNGTGDYTLALTTDMSSANWCPVGMSDGSSGGACTYPTINTTGSTAAGTIRVFVVRGSSEVAVDVAKVGIACFGDQ